METPTKRALPSRDLLHRLEALAAGDVLGGWPVEQVDIHVVHPQASEALVDLPQQPLPAEVLPGNAVGGALSPLGADDPVVAAVGQRPSDDLLTVPPAIHGRGVDQVDAGVTAAGDEVD